MLSPELLRELKAMYEQYKGSFAPDDRNVPGFLTWAEWVSQVSQS